MSSPRIGTWAPVAAVWRRRWLVLLTAVVGAATAVFISSLGTPSYVGSAKVFIGPRQFSQEGRNPADQSGFQPFVSSYAQELQSGQIAGRVAMSLGLERSADDLKEQITAHVIPETSVIELEVSDSSPAEAQRIATSFADEFVESITEQAEPPGARVLDRASRPTESLGPDPLRDGILGGLAGLVLAIGCVVAMDQFNPTLRTRSEVQDELAPLPLLASVPSVKLGSSHESVGPIDFFEAGPIAPASEAVHVLRAGIDAITRDRPVGTLLVTSPGAREGKSSVVLSLAEAVAATDARAIIVDADLRRPSIHEAFNLPLAPGLSEVLAGKADLKEALRPVKGYLAVLTAGSPTDQPAALLGSERMAELIRAVETLARVVILDSSRLLAVADVAILGDSVDAVLLVVRAGRTRVDEAIEGKAVLERLDAQLLGVVLNATDVRDGYGHGYHE